MGGPREGAYAGRSRAEPAAQAALAARGREGARFQQPAAPGGGRRRWLRHRKVGHGRPSHLAAERSQILHHEGHGHWDTPRGTNVDATVLTVALRRPALSVPPGCFLPILFFRGSGLLEGTGIRHQCVSRRAVTQARGDPELRAGWMA